MDGLLRYIGKAVERLSPDSHNGFVAICSFRATFEQYRVARLERQRSNLRNDVGPRFKDDCNYAKWAGFLVQDQALVELSDCQFSPERVRQIRNFPDTGGHLGDATLFDPQP